MKIKNINPYFLKNLQNETFVILQKARVLIWVCVITFLLLSIVTIINITTHASTHPFLINTINVAFLLSSSISLFFLRKGKYNFAVITYTIFLFIRVLTGCLIKYDIFLETGTNNNIPFMFMVIAFATLFGTRLFLTLISSLLLIINLGFVFFAYIVYNPQNINYLTGTTINMIIAIIGVYAMGFLISKTTDRALSVTEEELNNNKKLNKKLEENIEELQTMYEEMEAMNEELEDTSKDLIKSNNELSIFKEFADTSTQGFAMTNLQGKIIYTNPSMDTMTNQINPDKEINLIKDFYPEEYHEKIFNKIIPEVNKNNSWTGELPLLKDGKKHRPTIQNIFIIKNPSGAPVAYATVIIDITERKKLENQLIQSQKMEAVGRLAGGIAHDFNNYLTAIIGYSGLILNKMDDNEPHIDEIKEIMKASERSSSLTTQLLAFSRKQMLRPEIININNEVHNMEKLLSRTISENITLTTILKENLKSVKADPVQIEQVILNLAINARDAMPEGGNLIIRTENKILTPADCENIPDSKPGKYVKLTIEDTGIGIAPENQDLIFEPFFTTKEIGEGTGLGLSVIYGILQQQGGWINLYSEQGKGTVFSLYFPAFNETVTTKQKKEKPSTSFSGNGETILLVEDQEEVKNFAVTALTKYGYKVIDVTNANDAINIFKENPHSFDLVFSDLILPDKTGIDVIEKLLKIKPDLKFILCSGYSEHESHWQNILDRNYPFIQKPYTFQELLQNIYNLLN